MIVNKYANRGSLTSEVEVYPVPISIIIEQVKRLSKWLDNSKNRVEYCRDVLQEVRSTLTDVGCPE